MVFYHDMIHKRKSIKLSELYTKIESFLAAYRTLSHGSFIGYQIRIESYDFVAFLYSG